MPLRKYFKGHGEEVAADMRKQYGDDWQRVFYATSNKQKQRENESYGLRRKLKKK